MIMPWEKAGMKNKCDGCKYIIDTGEQGLLSLACKMDYGQCFEGHRWEPNDKVAKRLQSSEAKRDTDIRSEAENLVVYKRAILKFGQRSQVNVAIEEMSELTKELCKLNRGRDNRDHILEEIADVYIMLHQLTLIFDNPDEMQVTQYIDEKTKRLEELLEG